MGWWRNQVDAADLKSAGEIREGSNPSHPTNACYTDTNLNGLTISKIVV